MQAETGASDGMHVERDLKMWSGVSVHVTPVFLLCNVAAKQCIHFIFMFMEHNNLPNLEVYFV